MSTEAARNATEKHKPCSQSQTEKNGWYWCIPEA